MSILDTFCFLCLRASLLASVGIKNNRCYKVASCWEPGLQGPLRRAEGKGVKRSCHRLRSSQSLPLRWIWCRADDLGRLFCFYGVSPFASHRHTQPTSVIAQTTSGINLLQVQKQKNWQQQKANPHYLFRMRAKSKRTPYGILLSQLADIMRIEMATHLIIFNCSPIVKYTL